MCPSGSDGFAYVDSVVEVWWIVQAHVITIMQLRSYVVARQVACWWKSCHIATQIYHKGTSVDFQVLISKQTVICLEILCLIKLKLSNTHRT